MGLGQVIWLYGGKFIGWGVVWEVSYLEVMGGLIVEVVTEAGQVGWGEIGEAYLRLFSVLVSLGWS